MKSRRILGNPTQLGLVSSDAGTGAKSFLSSVLSSPKGAVSNSTQDFSPFFDSASTA